MTDQAAKTTAEASGLADIKGIAAALKAADDTTPESSSGDLTGGGFGSSAAASLVFEEPSSPISLTPEPSMASPLLAGSTARPPTRERPRGLAVAAGVLGVAVVILGGAALTQSGEAAEPTAAAPTVASAAVVTPEPDQPDQPDRPSTVADGMVAGVVGAAQVEPLEPEAEAQAENEEDPEAETSDDASGSDASGDRRARRNGGTGQKAPATAGADPGTRPAAPEPAPEAKPEPEPEPVDDATKFGVDCILNPTAPGCGPAKKKVVEDKTVDENLPDKLSNADVRAGFNSVKAKAKGCGVTHGIFPGSKVLVKVSIEGATGKVLSAEAMGEHAGTRGGQCVADHLKNATFKRFKKEVMGVTFPVLI